MNAKLSDRSPVSTIIFSYLLNAVGQPADLAINLAIFAVLAKDDAGLYSWVMAVTAFVGFSLDLGLSTSITREGVQTDFSPWALASAVAVVRIPIICLLAAFYLVWCATTAPSTELSIALFLASLTQIALVTQSIFVAWLRGQKRQLVTNAISAGQSILRLLSLATLFWVVGFSRPSNVFAVTLFTTLVTMLLVLAVTHRVYSVKQSHGIRRSSVPLGLMIRSGIAFGMIGLLTVVQNRLDWILVSAFLSESELANYAVANRMYEAFLSFAGVAALTAYPWLCRLSATGVVDKNLSILARIVAFGGTISALCIAYLLPPILATIWGTKYENSNGLMLQLFAAAPIALVCSMLYYTAVSQKLELGILPIAAVATLAQVAIDWIFLPRLGTVAAVVGMWGLLLITTAGLYLLVRLRGSIRVEWFWSTGFFVGSMMVFSSALSALDPSLEVRVLATVAVAILLGSRMLCTSDELMVGCRWTFFRLRRRFSPVDNRVS